MLQNRSSQTGEPNKAETHPNSIKLTADQDAAWRVLAHKAKAVEDALADLLLATAQSPIPDEYKPAIMDWIERAETFKGLSYFLAPQSEWLGGDSSDPKNFCYRLPHICRR